MYKQLTPPQRLAAAAVIAGFLALLPNVLTPLRAEYDALVLMTLATHITDGKPPITWAGPSVYPPGLPTLYSWIERAHLGYSATLVGVNWLAYVAAAIAIGLIVRLEPNAAAKWCTAALTIVFGFVTIRYMTLPMTDATYFGVATVAVAFLCGRSWTSWVAGVLCTALAISVRRNGVALVPAAAFAAIDWPWARRLLVDRWHRARGGLIATAILTMVVIGVAAAVFFQHATLGDLHEMYGRETVARQLAHNAIERVVEIGQVLCNMPLNRFPFGESTNLRAAILAGLAGWAVLLAGLWQRRTRLTAMDVYLIGFILILLIWPFDFVRFWLPIIPLLAVWAVEACVALCLKTWSRRVATGLVCVYCWVGLLSHAYSLRITFSPSAYNAVYTSGEYGRPFRVIRLRENQMEKDAKMEEIEAVLRRFGLREERGR